jgi:hypothetical protein
MLAVGALQQAWLDYPVALITVACIVTPAGMGVQLIVVEWLFGRSQTGSQKPASVAVDDQPEADESTAIEGARADVSRETITTSNPASQASQLSAGSTGEQQQHDEV